MVCLGVPTYDLTLNKKMSKSGIATYITVYNLSLYRIHEINEFTSQEDATARFRPLTANFQTICIITDLKAK